MNNLLAKAIGTQLSVQKFLYPTATLIYGTLLLQAGCSSIWFEWGLWCLTFNTRSKYCIKLEYVS